MRSWVLFPMCVLLGAACDASPEVQTSSSLDTTSGPLTDVSIVDTGPAPEEDVASDATDSADVEVLYPGYACGSDDQCSTGLCYGTATQQGAFEPAKCQTQCLDTFDFSKYCDSDDDCCKGRCCIGCGAREGLCVLD
jgi:hypothetical protein